MLDSLKLVIGEADAAKEPAGDDEVTIAGDVRNALEEKDDQALADALKQFILTCMQEY